MAPWAPATKRTEALRWLDDSGIRLQGGSHGSSSAVAEQHREHGFFAEVNGQASVFISLNQDHWLYGASSGKTDVFGILGWLYEILAQSGGRATVSASFMYLGQVEPAVGASAGSVKVTADLTRTSWPPRPDVHQNPPPGESVRSGRTDGKGGRQIFSPVSIGRTSGAVR